MHFELNKKNRQKNLNILFQEACGKGDLDKVIYYLESPELDIHANVHADNDLALIMATEQDHIHVIDYILQSELFVSSHNFSNMNKSKLEEKSIVNCIAKANLKIIKYLNKEVKKRKDRQLHRSGVA